jgi:hypothetical protein
MKAANEAPTSTKKKDSLSSNDDGATEPAQSDPDPELVLEGPEFVEERTPGMTGWGSEGADQYLTFSLYHDRASSSTAVPTSTQRWPLARTSQQMDDQETSGAMAMAT